MGSMFRIKYTLLIHSKQGTNLAIKGSHSESPTQLVAKLPMKQRIAALSEALPVVPPNQRDELAMMLIELASFATASPTNHQNLGMHPAAGPIELITRLPQRRRQNHANEAMYALARCWSSLSFPMKELSAGLGRDRWIQTARMLAKDPDPAARLASVRIAHDTADPGFAKIAGVLLADEHQTVRKGADKAMMRLTMVMLDHLPAYLLGEELAQIAATKRINLPVDPAVLELERCTLLGAIADAAWSFASHRCRSPLLSALLVMDRAVATPLERDISARMRRLLSERNHPSHSPIRTVLRRTPCPILRERALRWLIIAPISTAAIDRLSQADSIEEHQLVLHRAHLALRPKRAAKLHALRQGAGHGSDREHGKGPLPSREQYTVLGDESRLGLIRLSSLISMDDQVRRNLLEPTLADPSLRVRLRACDQSPTIDLPDYIYDIEEPIARHASMLWSSVGQTPPKIGTASWTRRNEIARLNARSPHPSVRRISNEESQRLTILNPSSPASRVHARRMYRHDPTGFVRLVRDYIANPSTTCDALMLIRRLEIEHRFELDLIAIVQSPSSDARARATAVMSLGTIDSNAARYVLSEALSDQDGRIRANAVESVRQPLDQVLELKADKHHRVRSSAIRRVIRDADPSKTDQARKAGQALYEMLHDEQPLHRLAAAWAAQRTLNIDRRELLGASWKPLIREIESLASGHCGGDEFSARIQIRAQRCMDRIESDFYRVQMRNEQAINHSSNLDTGSVEEW